MCKLRYHIQRIPLVMLLGLGLVFMIAGTASAHSTAPTRGLEPAHAKVYKAIPAIGSTITQAPTSVTVFTLENINPNPKISNLFVYSPSGELINQGTIKFSLSNPTEMSIAIKPTGNGVYIVRWITVSALDGDPDEGAFVFTVQPSAPAKATTPTTPATPTTSASSGIALWVPIVVGILALLVGFGGGFGIGRRNAKPSVSSMRKALSKQQEE